MVNRDRHEITIEILRLSTNGKRKTELMRDVGLSYTQAKQYLPMLIEKELLELDGKGLYKTTKKGSKFLEDCKICPLFTWSSKTHPSKR
jgi:predicted transcriptional regulator